LRPFRADTELAIYGLLSTMPGRPVQPCFNPAFSSRWGLAWSAASALLRGAWSMGATPCFSRLASGPFGPMADSWIQASWFWIGRERHGCGRSSPCANARSAAAMSQFSATYRLTGARIA